MPIVADIETQNICCAKVLNILQRDRNGIPITYRSMIKNRQWDNYCKITGIDYNQAFQNLDSTITIPQDTLSQIGFKLNCTELCPFHCCLDEIKSTEWELIRNWKMIEDILSWCSIGMRMDKVAAWHQIPVESVRKWNTKSKKLEIRAEIYRGFQDYLDFI
jgi:hypothetical protein